MENLEAVVGIGYWLRWQVVVCALILILPATIALRLLRSRHKDPIDPSHFWVPRWGALHPSWLLFYRAFAFASMALLLYQTVATFGFFVFFFYTQWTFALVMVYFAGTLIKVIKMGWWIVRHLTTSYLPRWCCPLVPNQTLRCRQSMAAWDCGIHRGELRVRLLSDQLLFHSNTHRLSNATSIDEFIRDMGTLSHLLDS
nr:uncharacterized protein LOC109182898 isoform X1 [Ipomoea trifida]